MQIDYTKYAVGMAVSAAGLIIKCPKCGRHGEQRKGTKRFVMRVVHGAQIVASVSSPRDRKGLIGQQSARRGTKLQYTDRCDIKHGECDA